MGQWRASMDIPATGLGVAAVRHVVAALLSAWQLAELRDDAVLLASELVTNAYRHAPGTDSFELEVVRRTHGIRIALADGSSIRPLIKELSHERPGGRGMTLVAAIATGWGAEDHNGGKRVWVDLDKAQPQ
jgi:anti-sigma regulatory factor (Ser/Thr protein kinase)